jgi:hypothetical protein
MRLNKCCVVVSGKRLFNSIQALWQTFPMPSRSQILDAVQHADFNPLACRVARARRLRSWPSRTRRAAAVPSTISGYPRRPTRLKPSPSIFSLMKCMRSCLSPKSLRQQLIVLGRKARRRARLTNGDRWFFVQLYRWFPSILRVLTIIQPETVVRWHRAGFRRYWHWKSRRRGLRWWVPVSGQKFLAFWSFRRGFRAPVSARYFPISVFGEGRLVRLLAETSSTRDRVKLLRPVNQEHRN